MRRMIVLLGLIGIIVFAQPAFAKVKIRINATVRHGGGNLMGSGTASGTLEIGIVEVIFNIRYYVCAEKQGECGGIIVSNWNNIYVDFSNISSYFPSEAQLMSIMEEKINTGNLSGRVLLNKASVEAVYVAEQMGYIAREKLKKYKGSTLPPGTFDAIFNGNLYVFKQEYFTLGVWDFRLTETNKLPFIWIVEIDGR